MIKAMLTNPFCLLAAVAILASTATAFTVPTSSNSLATRSSASFSSALSVEVSEDNDDSAIAEEETSISAPPVERHTIFCGNLPFGLAESDLNTLFRAHGAVSNVSMPRNKETGTPRGFAFVDMATVDDMTAAIDALDGTDVEGRTIRVMKSVPKEDLPARSNNNNSNAGGGSRNFNEVAEGFKKLYVGNIPFDCTREEVSEVFAEFGEVKDVFIPQNAETGSGRGFAFVTMEEEGADRSIEEKNGSEFGGRRLVVSLPLKPGERNPPRGMPSDRTKLYVGNLSYYTVADTLRMIFEEFGTVHDCYLPEDPSTGGSRGFGFVTMEKEAAREAIAEIDGCEVDGRSVRVNEAKPKGAPRDDDDFEF